MLDIVYPLIFSISSELATDSMSHSTVHDTVPGKVDIHQSHLFPVIPVGFDLTLRIFEDLVNLLIISFSFFCGNLVLRESELLKSSLHRVDILERIWQVSETALIFGLPDLGVIGYTDKDAKLLLRFDVADFCFLMRKCLYHM